MANEENLIPQAHVLTEEELSRGGKRSGETRRLKAIANKYGSLDAPPAVIANLIQNGLLEKGQKCTYDDALILAQYAKALSGNVKSARFVADVRGEIVKTEIHDIQGIQIERDSFDDLINVVQNVKDK